MQENCTRLKVRCACGWMGSRNVDNPCLMECPECEGTVTVKPKRVYAGHRPASAQRDMNAALVTTEDILVTMGSRAADAENIAPAMLMLLLQRISEADAEIGLDRRMLLPSTRTLLTKISMADMTVCREGRCDWLTERGKSVLALMLSHGVRPGRMAL